MKISFLTTHFRDIGWLRLWLERVRTHTPKHCISNIVIIDQDRTPASADTIRGLAGPVQVLQFPKSDRHFSLLGHDHPAVLNQAITRCEGDIVCLWDSDAHPISPHWFSLCEQHLRTYDAVLAQDPYHPGLSHPCFMVFSRTARVSSLAFDEGMFDETLDR